MESVVFLLDKSGSMACRMSDTLGGYKTMIDDLKDKNIVFTLYTFSDDITQICQSVSISDAPELTTTNYRPTGGTALFDAIGTVLLSHKTGKLIIITDGQENSSRKYTKSGIKDMIAASDLTITYIGADIEQAEDIGIKDLTFYDGDNTPQAFEWASQQASA